MTKKMNEDAYQINQNLLLYQKKTEEGVEYMVYDKQSREQMSCGFIDWATIKGCSIPNVMEYARTQILAGLGLDLYEAQRVSIRMLEPCKSSGIHSRMLWSPNEMPENDIRFINSRYEDLFWLPNGSYLQIKQSQGTMLMRCEFIDPYHLFVGSNAFHICEFAERMERLAVAYGPEFEIMGKTAAWKLEKDQYLSIQTCSSGGYNYILMNENYETVNSGTLDNPRLTMLEARTAIFLLLSISPQKMYLMDYKELMEHQSQIGG